MEIDEELGYFLKNVRQSMESLIHPLLSMRSRLNQWLCKLEDDCQDLQEIQQLEQKLETVLALISEIAEKKNGTPSGLKLPDSP